MLCIRNDNIEISCHENGRGLAILDIKRGTRWILDEKTQVYAIKGDENQLQYLQPLKSEIIQGEMIAIKFMVLGRETEIFYILHEDYVEVRLIASPNEEIAFISMPGSFIPEGEQEKILMPVMQGMLWEGGGKPFQAYLRESGHGGFSMAMMGYLGVSGGLLFAPESYDDVRWWIGKDEANRYWLANLQMASLGAMRYDRVARLYPTEADIVSIAKRYRQRIIEKGRFKSWEQKLEDRPSLERMFGALWCFIGYCQDDINYANECEKLKKYGFDRAFIYPVRFNTYNQNFEMGGKPPINIPSEQVEYIKNLGYDVAPWSWINEAMDDGTEKIRNLYRKDGSGNMTKGWRMDNQQWYTCCTSFMEEYQKKAITESVSDLTWDHFDVITSATNNECFALDHPNHLGHPISKSEDREWIRRLLLTAQIGDRPVSSESFNDAYSLEYDIGSVKAWPIYNNSHFWPVPLTMLVYHDSMIHSWWEVHNYNNPYHSSIGRLHQYGGGKPRLMAALDALMGCPPDVFPFGAQYMWTGKGSETFLYKYRFEDPEVQLALKLALPVAMLHKRIGKLEMVHFKILSEDGGVQETAFSDGTRIVANFNPGLRGDIKGIKPLLGETWRVED